MDNHHRGTTPRPTEADTYSLTPHPEGGWYRRTWTSTEQIRTLDGRTRPAATLIQFCLPAGECSAWHRVGSDEIWIWNGAGRISLQLGGAGPHPIPDMVRVLGAGASNGELLQALVPAGVWQRTLPADAVGLASCLVSPGFDFADFTLGPPF